MPRIARVVVPGVPHHVTQRGHRREEIFRRDADREHFLGLLAKYSAEQDLVVQAWCLMPNHVHLIVVPERDESLSMALRPLFLSYAQYVQRVYGVPGRLWQGRFHSCPMDERHAWTALRYVERNPVRAGLVAVAEEYPWSSAAAHCGLRRDPVARGTAERATEIGDWSAWLKSDGDAAETELVRARTHTGRPAGSVEWVQQLEARFGRKLAPGKGGRPKQAEKHG